MASRYTALTIYLTAGHARGDLTRALQAMLLLCLVCGSAAFQSIPSSFNAAHLASGRTALLMADVRRAVGGRGTIHVPAGGRPERANRRPGAVRPGTDPRHPARIELDRLERSAANPAASGRAPLAPPSAQLLARLRDECDIGALSPLQQVATDAALRGADAMIHAETGSGKTLCFALPLLALLEQEQQQQPRDAVALRALVVVPTLELAAQIVRVLEGLMPGVAAALGRGAMELPPAAIVVGPPAMLLGLLSGPSSSLVEAAAGLRFLVLDEADATLQPLGKYSTRREKEAREAHPKPAATLLRRVSELRGDAVQILAASATVGRPLRREMAALSGRQFELIRAPAGSGESGDGVGEKGAPARRAVGLASGLTVEVITADADNLIGALHSVLRTERAAAPLLFVGAGRSLPAELRLLRGCELDAAALDEAVASGGGPDGGATRLLVASPSGARGLDLPSLDLVVIMGVPASADALVHMAGRCGRQGAAGKAVVLATPEEARARIPALASQLGLELARPRHVADRVERWAEMWSVHEKVVQAEEKGLGF